MATPFANPERQFRTRRDTSPALIHNIYTFYEFESSESESEDVGEINIETLTLEQYLTLNNTRRRISNPENATFEIKGQFLRELCKTTFSASSTKNAIKHIGKVLEVATSEALKSIQELVDHSHKWHNEESKNTPTPFCIIAEKLKVLNHEMDELRVHVRKTNTNGERKILHEEIKSIRTSEIRYNRNPKPINMVIEMTDRSMQSPKGIVKNVMVKINKFIFSVDFIILDIVEDDKVPIILGRPMLATTHARIDVFGKNISLEVGTEHITFDINERESSAVISLVCVINNLSEVNKFNEHKDLEELLLSDDDLGIFPNDNDLSPNLENYDTMFLSPPGSARLNDDSSEMFCNPNSNSSISMDEFVEMDDIWDNLDFRDLTNEATKFLVKPV
ncbi:homeodomain-like protein [Tanacetum coccineum]